MKSFESSTTRIIGVAVVLLGTGCAGLPRATPSAPGETSATHGALAVPEPAAPSVTSAHGLPKTGAAPDATVAAQSATAAPNSATAAVQSATAAVETTIPAAAATVSPSTGKPAAKAELPAVKANVPTAKAPVPVNPGAVPAEQIRKQESAAPTPLKEQASAQLDLKSLETRLKDTKAIGVLTKLALKNQVDDLLNQFRAYYQGRLKTTLADLRRPYDLLLLKVLALLQDTDPALARAIVASREGIWGILADPAKFATV